MIALDTNVLLRFITEDDPRQLTAARALLARPGETFFIGDLVLVETIWTLLRLYRFSRQEVCTILRDFLGKTDVVFEDEAAVSAAVHEMEAGGDLADTLIVAKAREHGCSGVATFDEDLVRRHPNFAVRP